MRIHNPDPAAGSEWSDTGPSPEAPVIGTLTAEATLNLNNRSSCQRVQSTTLHFLVKGSSSYKLVEGSKCTFSHWKNYMTLITGVMTSCNLILKISGAQVLEESADRHQGSGPTMWVRTLTGHFCWHSSSYWVTVSYIPCTQCQESTFHSQEFSVAPPLHTEVLLSYKCERLSPVP